MKRRSALVLFPAVLILALSNLSSAEKLKFGTALKIPPHNSLPPLAAEEKGFWKGQGLDVEWVPFEGGTDLSRAVAARVINIASTSAIDSVLSMTRGIPKLMIADQKLVSDYYVFVRSDSPMKEAKDLRGARIAVPRLGSVAHAYGIMVGKAMGQEKEFRFVGTGGLPQSVASLKSGAVDAILSRIFSMAPLYYSGEIKGIVPIRNYLPQEWLEGVLAARKDFAEKNPEVVRKVVKAFFQATDYIMKDRAWAVEKMKSYSRYSEETSRGLYELLHFGKDGRMEKKAVENVRNFLIEYNIVSQEKMPAADQLFTNDYIQ